MLIQAVIFDFDGLILDTEEPEYRTWQEIYQQYGAELALTDWLPLIGVGANTITFDIYGHLEAQIGRRLDHAEIRRQRGDRYREIMAKQPLQPGVEAWIADAQRLGIHLGVASSSPRSWVVGNLTERGLVAHFEQIVCGDEVAHAKPYPDVYQSVLQKIGVTAEHSIALEDSPNGMRAAKQAGMFCIVIPNPLTHGLPFEQADLRLNSLADCSLEDLMTCPSG